MTTQVPGLAPSRRAASRKVAGSGLPAKPSCSASFRRPASRTGRRRRRRRGSGLRCGSQWRPPSARRGAAVDAADRRSTANVRTPSARTAAVNSNVLPVGQSPRRVGRWGVTRCAERQFDARGGEEAGDTVDADPTVDVASVVLFGEPSPAGASSGEEIVEELLPGPEVDPRGVGDDSVHVHDHGVEAVGHRSTMPAGVHRSEIQPVTRPGRRGRVAGADPARRVSSGSAPP